MTSNLNNEHSQSVVKYPPDDLFGHMVMSDHRLAERRGGRSRHEVVFPCGGGTDALKISAHRACINTD